MPWSNTLKAQDLHELVEEKIVNEFKDDQLQILEELCGLLKNSCDAVRDEIANEEEEEEEEKEDESE